MGTRVRRGRIAVLVVSALVVTACGKGAQPGQTTAGASGSSSTGPGATGGANKATGPGVSATAITVGNVSTVGGPVPGLFKGAQVGVQAYFDYVNSTGGVHGRQLTMQAGDDQFSCTKNSSATASLLPNVIAFVGNYSLFDNCGGLQIPTTVANVSVSLNTSVTARPNTFSAQPSVPGWADGDLLYFKQHYPQAVQHVGALVGSIPSAEASWTYEQHAMLVDGYHISVVDQYPVLQASFTADVIRFQQAGVQMVVMDQADPASIARFVDAMQLQNYHPTIVESGGVAYTGSFIKQAGVSAAETLISAQHQALYLGSDAKSVPEVTTFDDWVQKADPGFTPDIFTLFGWASAMLFVQALQSAGQNPTRASLLAQLAKITTFDAGGLLAPADPANKTPSICYILAKVVNGQWERVDSPPSGFICTGHFITYPNGK